MSLPFRGESCVVLGNRVPGHDLLPRPSHISGWLSETVFLLVKKTCGNGPERSGPANKSDLLFLKPLQRPPRRVRGKSWAISEVENVRVIAIVN